MAYQKAFVGSALAILVSLPQAATAADSSKKDAASKVVCREIIPVGTIVDKQLICMSKATWNKNREDRKENEDLSREYLQLRPPANPAMMQLGRADWAKLQPLRAKGKLPYLQLVKHTRDLLRSKACTLPGQSAGKFDILVNYGVKFDAAGKVSRVLVEDSQCAHINALVGMTVLARAERGDFNAPAGSLKGWYADKINLTLL